MKKLIGLAVVIALLSFVACADAAVGYRKDGEYQGAVADVNIDGFASSDGRVLTIFSNGHRSGVTANVSSESNLLAAALAYGLIVKATVGTSGGEYVSLADGTPGQMVTITLTDYNDTDAFIITDDKVAGGTMTKTGWDDITFNSDLDSITLLWLDDTYGWIIVGNNGCSIT
jgi:hypothetical protein